MDTELARAAAAIWAKVFGVTRNSCPDSSRRSTAAKKGWANRQQTAGTLEAFRGKRKAEVSDLVMTSNFNGTQIQVETDDYYWTEKHRAESMLQKQRRVERALDTAAHNGLTVAELNQELNDEDDGVVAVHKHVEAQKKKSHNTRRKT